MIAFVTFVTRRFGTSCALALRVV